MFKRNRPRVENTNENYAKCLCYTERCPTYNQSSLAGGLFCARGRSEKTLKKRDVCALLVRFGPNAVERCILLRVRRGSVTLFARRRSQYHSPRRENQTTFSTSLTASRTSAGHRAITTLLFFTSATCCGSDRLYPSRPVQATDRGSFQIPGETH